MGLQSQNQVLCYGWTKCLSNKALKDDRNGHCAQLDTAGHPMQPWNPTASISSSTTESSNWSSITIQSEAAFSYFGKWHCTPQCKYFQRLREDVTISAALHECLPKGSKLLAITPADKAATGDETLVQPEIFRVNSPMDESQCMVQTWDIPWEPEKFVDEVVKADHPIHMATFLLPRLQVLDT